MSEPDDTVERPGVDEVKGWVGARLDEIGGASVGKIEGVYVDERSAEPEWLLVKIGRFGRRSLVPARDAVGGVGHVWVPFPRDTLRGAPRVEPGHPLDIERETELSTHYGIARAAQLADRPPGAVTSRPAE
jgi:hypothetical protein